MNIEKEVLKIAPIELEWQDWVMWNNLKKDARKGGIKLPDQSGVYDVKYNNAKKSLTIGKASSLRMRIKQGLVKGKSAHSAGKKIRAKENTSKIIVRWAITDRPAAAEEELHKKYKQKFGELPKYVKHT